MNRPQQWAILLPMPRRIPLKRDGVLKSVVPGKGRGGRRMNGKSSYCGFGNIDLVINNAMNLKWNSSVSAKAGYFCHKRHIRELKNSDNKRDGEERGRRRCCFSWPSVWWVERRWFHLGVGVQGKFSASPNLRTLNKTPYKFNNCPHFPTRNSSISCNAAWWPLLPSCQDLRVSCSLPRIFPFSTFLIFIVIFPGS